MDLGHRRQLDIGIELPGSELGGVAPHEQWGEILDRIAAHVEQAALAGHDDFRRTGDRLLPPGCRIDQPDMAGLEGVGVGRHEAGPGQQQADVIATQREQAFGLRARRIVGTRPPISARTVSNGLRRRPRRFRRPL